MRAAKANITKTDKTLLSFGSLISAPVCLFAFLLFPFLDESGIPYSAALACAAGSAVLAVVFLPLLYDRINNSVAVSVGRYHIPLAVSGLAGPLCTIFLFSAGEWFSPPAATAVFCITLPGAVLSGLVFSYASGSVRARLTDEKDQRFTVLSGIFSLTGAAAVLICYFICGHFFGSLPAATAGQLVSVIYLLSGAAVYFSSAAYMPRYIRLVPPDGFSLKEKYAAFYQPFTEKKRAALSAGYFMLVASLLLFSLTASAFAGVLSLAPEFFLYASGALVVLYALASAVAGKTVSARNLFGFTFSAALAALIAAGVMILCVYSGFPAGINGAAFIAAAAVTGASGGIARAVKNYDTQEIIVNSAASGGIARNFYNLLFVCALMLACLVAAAVHLTGFTAPAAVSGVSAALCAGSAVMAGFAKKSGGVMMSQVGLTETKEIIRDINERRTDDEKLADLIAEIKERDD